MIRKVFGVFVLAIAALLHVWYRGVLAAPEVKRRKAARPLAASAGREPANARPKTAR